MDLRSMLNSDARPRSPPQQPSPARQKSDQRNSAEYSRPADAQTPGSVYNSGYYSRPPQPPPLQPPRQSPIASSAYPPPLQSPYQYNSNSSIGGGPPPQHAQSPSQPYPPPSRDGHPVTPASPAVYAQPSLASPYTPQPAPSIQHQQKQQQPYFSHPSGSQHAQYPPGSASRSSHSSHASESPHQQSLPQQQHQFSPPSQRSQPGTPLGPPSAPLHRPPSQSVQSQSIAEHRQSHPVDLRASQERHAPDIHMGESPSATHQTISPSRREPRQPEQSQASHYPGESDRERSVSISPKTIVSRQSLSQDQRSTPHRTSTDEDRWRDSSPANHFHNGPTTDSLKRQSLTPQQGFSQPSAMQRSSSPLVRHTPSRETSAAPRPVKSEATSRPSSSLGPPPKRKKIRYDEPPIYARKATRMGAKGPVIPNPRPPISKHSSSRFPIRDNSPSTQANAPPSTSIPTPAKPPVNGATPPNGPVTAPPPPEPIYGALGPWEPSITGKIPFEEVTKNICDFLFKEVVLRKDLAAGAAGAAATGSIATLEIEAKLGRIMDKDRGDRLRLPIMTECIIHREGSGIRTAFESSMSSVSFVFCGNRKSYNI